MFSQFIDQFLFSYKFWLVFLVTCGILLGRHVTILLNCLNTAATGKTRYVLITDCEDELGYKIAMNLCASKVGVIAGCTSIESAQRLEADINFNGYAFVLDVTKDEDIENIYERMKDELQYIGLWGIINNKRSAHVSPIEELSIEEMNDVMNVNFWGMVKVTKRFLPWIKKMKGRIVNLSNSNENLLFHTSGNNVATAASNSYSHALRKELKKWCVSVSIIDIGLDPCLKEEQIIEMWDMKWKDVTPLVQQQYGEEYYKKGMENMIEQYGKHKVDNMSLLVDKFSNAMLSSNPRIVYESSMLHSYGFLLLNLIPEQVKEMILDLIFIIPTPKSLVWKPPIRRKEF